MEDTGRGILGCIDKKEENLGLMAMTVFSLCKLKTSFFKSVSNYLLFASNKEKVFPQKVKLFEKKFKGVKLGKGCNGVTKNKCLIGNCSCRKHKTVIVRCI